MTLPIYSFGGDLRFSAFTSKLLAVDFSSSVLFVSIMSPSSVEMTCCCLRGFFLGEAPGGKSLGGIERLLASNAKDGETVLVLKGGTAEKKERKRSQAISSIKVTLALPECYHHHYLLFQCIVRSAHSIVDALQLHTCTRADTKPGPITGTMLVPWDPYVHGQGHEEWEQTVLTQFLNCKNFWSWTLQKRICANGTAKKTSLNGRSEHRSQSIASAFPLQCKYRARCSQLGTAVLSLQEFLPCQVNSTASAGYCTHQQASQSGSRAAGSWREYSLTFKGKNSISRDWDKCAA